MLLKCKSANFNEETLKTIEVSDTSHLSIQDIGDIANQQALLKLSRAEVFRAKIEKGAQFLSDLYENNGEIYGVTTGYGDSCTQSISRSLLKELPLHLTRFHGCGMGAVLTPMQVRAVLAIRLVSLCRGVSGVSFELLERLELMLEHDILPIIPSEGSVGASGDLTPLSYVAAVIAGERKVLYQGKECLTEVVFREKGISPYELQPKEALAIMNGTTVMTALAVEAYQRAHYVVGMSARLTSMTSLALKGNPKHYEAKLFEAKPHRGQAKVASYIRQDLEKAPDSFPEERLQDRYSTRCAPHIIGVLADMLPSFKLLIETEINSANDNPIIDVSGEESLILHGGHFYGGHVCYVMDSLKILVANLADLLDRQMVTLVDPKFNAGLPANLSSVEGPRAVINHGLKAVQIAASAWTAEALKGTMPASVFSRSTENHNQDKVSLGTIAARDALRVLQLTEQVVSAHMVATIQAIRLREREGVLRSENYPEDLKSYMADVKGVIPFLEEDAPLDELLNKLTSLVQLRHWPLYGDFV